MKKLSVIFSLLLTAFAYNYANASVHMALCAIPKLQPTLLSEAKGLNPKVLKLAIKAHDCAIKRGIKLNNKRYLTIIDYSLPSSKKRLWVLDLKTDKVLYNLHVAHGKRSGGKKSNYFSNVPQSKASSVGLYVSTVTYIGHAGLTLRLKGLEKGFNDHALKRLIVIHGAPYVSKKFLKAHGRMGRSWGCPSVSKKYSKALVKLLKGGTLVFGYYPEKKWLKTSTFLHCEAAKKK